MADQSPAHALFQVGTKIILRNRSGKILLLLRANKSSSRQTYWELPGGRVAENETFEEAVLREVQEETGITKVDDLLFLSMKQSDYRIPVSKEFVDVQESDITVGLIFAFYEGIVADETIVVSHEHEDYRWVTEDEAFPILVDGYGFNTANIILKK